MTRYKDIAGQRFGHLIAAQQAGRDARNNVLWLCRCDCGGQAIVRCRNLCNGHAKSCGCGKIRRKHGHAKDGERHPLYKTWQSMRNRCRNSNDPNHEYYGARGIAVCERWGDFENFIADVGPKPSPEHSLDRADPAGNYEPANVRWATKTEQAKNRRPRRR